MTNNAFELKEPRGTARIQVSACGGDDSEIPRGPVRLLLAKMPRKVRYRPGEAISFDGLVVMLNGRDVTADCTLSTQQGSVWKAGERERAVRVSHPSVHGAEFVLKRARNAFAPLAALALVVAIGGGCGAAYWFVGQASGDEGGSYLIPQGSMTDAEARQMLDDMVEKSRIMVNLAPNMVLREDGQLRVNFIVEEPNNGLSERLEIVQDGRVVYRSGVVNPGFMVEWAASQGARPGDATATVYAVADGADTGNPVSVEVQIAESGK